jgi:hypothetical protein
MNIRFNSGIATTVLATGACRDIRISIGMVGRSHCLSASRVHTGHVRSNYVKTVEVSGRAQGFADDDAEAATFAGPSTPCRDSRFGNPI